MTPKEFTDRTGLTPTDKEFVKIHSLYMSTLLDKDDFCKDWKNHQQSLIIDSLHTVAENRELQLDYLRRERSALVDLLIQEADANMSETLKNQAIKMVGHAEVIRRMFDLGIALWPGDKDYIVNNLPTA